MQQSSKADIHKGSGDAGESPGYRPKEGSDNTMITGVCVNRVKLCKYPHDMTDHGLIILLYHTSHMHAQSHTNTALLMSLKTALLITTFVIWTLFDWLNKFCFSN